MKKISKAHVPEELTRWIRENAPVSQNLVYGRACFPHAKVLQTLLVEQGFICAYTLKRIDQNSAHVEHLKPQTRCRSEDAEREASGQACVREDIAWINIVACFPEPQPAAPPAYGAVKKNSWWDPDLFVSPLHDGCELRFRFTADGAVAPGDAADAAAKITIENIDLGNAKLCELRETVFKRAGVHRRAEKPITSIAKVEQLIAGWVHKHHETKAYAEFCVPLVQVAKEYAHFLRGRGVTA